MENKKMRNVLVVLCVLFIIGIILFFMFFRNNMSKNLKIGNNSTSQEIVDYILNISSYEAKVEVEVKSNKNSNKYILKQEYKKPDLNSQQVLEPTNIAGTKIVRDGQDLRIESTNLNLNTVFEKYEYISENCLDLSCFIEDYKKDSNAKFKEENNQIIMKTSDSSNSIKSKTLYIDKENSMPTKMEVVDNNKNTTVYILYNEVNVNS
ncbi:MAG: hypothetical protein HFJ40_00880 [Clostridia bacterium]|nr:hypothetical protein [Clostridia bacterium]